MMTWSRTLAFAFGCALLSAGAVSAQTTQGGAAPGANPLDPGFKDPPRIGLEVGFSSAWMGGRFQVGCGDFEKGARLNPLIALAYDQTLGGAFHFEGLLGFQSRGLIGTYNSRENILATTNNGNIRTDVDFENVGRFSASYFFVLPSVKFYFTKGLYAGVGASAGFLTGASAQYTKNILSKTISSSELGLAEVFYPESESSDPYSKVFEEEERPDAAGFALDGVFYVGAEIPVNKKLKIGPRLLMTVPFTSVLSDPEMKISTFQILIGGRYTLD